ncbi:hypothetical protein B6N13_14990 [Marinomonas sp. UCMA 3892]|uniref:hypothetical protein n=1 Tax=unclassified Marinomonas TaxID=196814 RepID=UPI00146E2BAF|nr:hypothetical protein [Marinomonas sp. UCMA 3892]NLU99383.1 hypothetical protein [Marinomonas sp. UCMA 3892]
MNKFTLQLLSASSLTILLSGCSVFFTDHSDDYQEEKPVTSTLELPAGSMPVSDALVIPNEKNIANLDGKTAYTTPRAPFVFYPMVAVATEERDDAIEFSVPADIAQVKRIVADFLTALHGDGTSIASQSDSQIISVPFDFHPQGWWASLWSDITRIHPAQTAFSFRFHEQEEGKTLVTVQFRDEQQDVEPGNWMSPVQNDDAYSVAVRLWGTMGRQLNQSSAYLSNRGDVASFPIWVDHHGLFAIHLGNNVSPSDLETKLNAAGIYLIPGSDQLLAPVPPEDVARVGDVVDLTLPLVDSDKIKSLKTIRRNLDDVSWEEREYTYKITHQKAGDFLVIDVSSMDSPEVVSYHLAQRFVN